MVKELEQIINPTHFDSLEGKDCGELPNDYEMGAYRPRLSNEKIHPRYIEVVNEVEFVSSRAFGSGKSYNKLETTESFSIVDEEDIKPTSHTENIPSEPQSEKTIVDFGKLGVRVSTQVRDDAIKLQHARSELASEVQASLERAAETAKESGKNKICYSGKTSGPISWMKSVK